MEATPKNGIVYLIPTVLAEDGYASIPPSVVEAVNSCAVFFVEHERTARRYLKKLIPSFVIDDHIWYPATDLTPELRATFRETLQKGQNVGILSEAGCPGVADPGQDLAALAHSIGAIVRPLAGPSSILLALMASGLNGQHFSFHGYLPVAQPEREKVIRALETESARTGCTQIFIETPYRNETLFDALLKHCRMDTRLCIATNMTGASEQIKTRRISEWKKQERSPLHKIPTIFLLSAG